MLVYPNLYWGKALGTNGMKAECKMNTLACNGYSPSSVEMPEKVDGIAAGKVW